MCCEYVLEICTYSVFQNVVPGEVSSTDRIKVLHRVKEDRNVLKTKK